MADGLGVNLVLVLRDGCVLGRVLVQELLELLLEASDFVDQGVEEALALAFVVEAMLGEGNDVEPHLLIHPRELLVAVVDT